MTEKIKTAEARSPEEEKISKRSPHYNFILISVSLVAVSFGIFALVERTNHQKYNDTATERLYENCRDNGGSDVLCDCAVTLVKSSHPEFRDYLLAEDKTAFLIDIARDSSTDSAIRVMRIGAAERELQLSIATCQYWNDIYESMALALETQNVLAGDLPKLIAPIDKAEAHFKFGALLDKLKSDIEPAAEMLRAKLRQSFFVGTPPDPAQLRDVVNMLDRAFARGLNAQDIMVREFAKLTTPAEQAEARAAFEARLAKLRADLEPMATIVRAKLLVLEPPDYTLDPAKISDEANAAFLAKIDADPAYTKTASGLRYKPIKTVAEGRQPTPANEVTVHYKGTFIEGTEFDSSYKRNEPATFPLGNLINGWIEGIPLMKVGETFELVLPYDLAYGAFGRGSIPPRQTLVFQVELISVADAPATP